MAAGWLAVVSAAVTPGVGTATIPSRTVTSSSPRKAPLSAREFLGTLIEVVLDFGVLIFAVLMSFLATMGILAIASYVLMVPGFLIFMTATSAIIKYAAIVSRSLAFGMPVPAAPSSVLEYFGELWAFLPWLVLVGYSLLYIAIAESVSPAVAFFCAALLLPVVPALLAAVIVNRGLTPLFRLGEVIRLIKVTGVDYLKILLVWLLLGLVSWWLQGRISGVTSLFLALLAMTLEMFALFAASGIVLFHHHRALELPIKRDTQEARQAAYAAEQLERERQQARDQVYAFFSRDNSVAGLQRIQAYVDTHTDDVDAIEWFLNQMQTWESSEPALMVARNYVTKLLATEGASRDAIRVLRWCLRTDERFLPHARERQQAADLLAPYPEFERARNWPGVSIRDT